MTPKYLRIISTVPSITELLFDLGLDDRVIGITRFCIHPEQWYRSKQRIGGTKNLHLNKIKELKPDLIISNKEENTKEEIESLMMDFEVLITDIKTIDDNLGLINILGQKLSCTERALELTHKLQSVMESLHVIQKASAVYLIWKDPYMTTGGDTFINNMLENVGFKNLYSDQIRYPQIPIEELIRLNPQFVLLSSEPYPFGEKHIAELQNELPDTKILLVDGEAFSWYGSRIIKKAEYLKSIQTKIQTFVA